LEQISKRPPFIQTISDHPRTVTPCIFFPLRSKSPQTATNHPLVYSSSITTLSFLLFFSRNDWIACTSHAVMSKVITVGIQLRFKIHRNVDRRVNVSQFESHGGFRARGGQRADRELRFNPFSRVGGPFVIIEASRFDSPFLSLGAWSTCSRPVRIIPLEKARQTRPPFRLLIYVSVLDYTCIVYLAIPTDYVFKIPNEST